MVSILAVTAIIATAVAVYGHDLMQFDDTVLFKLNWPGKEIPPIVSFCYAKHIKHNKKYVHIINKIHIYCCAHNRRMQSSKIL